MIEKIAFDQTIHSTRIDEEQLCLLGFVNHLLIGDFLKDIKMKNFIRDQCDCFAEHDITVEP